jgi:CheY-like chemotaxis protein
VAKDRAPLLATDLSETQALVLSTDSQRVKDLTRFLDKAGATVHQSVPLGQSIVDGSLCIVAVDGQAFGAAQQIAEGPLQNKVVILRIIDTRSGLIQRTTDNVTSVDHALLTRRRFLTAVAVANGKLPPEVDTLPGSAQNDDMLPFVKGGKDARSPDAGTSGRGKILVAEDNEINQIVIDRQLTTLGYSADMANDGVEAFDMWMAGEYELILNDLHMPRMDGYDLAAKIRRVEEQTDRARVRIVALTANAIKGEAERCLETGMDGYLSKPITLEHLKEALLKATKQQV